MEHQNYLTGLKILFYTVLSTEKYGVIPKKCFPESHSSEASRRMNDILNHKVHLHISCFSSLFNQVHIPVNHIFDEAVLTVCVSLRVTAERILPKTEEHGGK